MSLFLIYFEIGKPVTMASPPPPIEHFPVNVALKGRRGPPRPALALTDGGSSAAFLAFGDRVLARAGTALRVTLVHFLRERLALGAHPHLIFLWFDGLVESALIDIDNKIHVPLARLDVTLESVAPSELIEIIGKDEGQVSGDGHGGRTSNPAAHRAISSNSLPHRHHPQGHPHHAHA